jgi:hypothetical protein
VKIIASLLLTAFFAAHPRPQLQTPIEGIARELLANFAAGRFEAATKDFNDTLRPMVTAQVLAQVKAQLDERAGKFWAVNEAHPRTRDGFRAIELLATFEKYPVSVVVVFDSFDRVGAVYFNPILPPPVDPALEARARALLTNFTAGRFDEVVKPFDPTMRAQLTPANLAGLAADIAGVYGVFQSVTEVHQRSEKNYRVIDLTLSYTKMPAVFRVAFDGADRVTALHISPYKKE